MKRQPKDATITFVLDENLGTTILANQLRTAGLQVMTFEQLSMCGEQDPWAFYYCGKQGYCLVTSDKAFLDHFTHMAAISLGKTRIISFTRGGENVKKRGKLFVKAKARILRIMAQEEPPFVVSLGVAGEIRVVDKKPMPKRKLCRPEHWESYLRVCKAEGIDVPEEAYTVPGSDYLVGRTTAKDSSDQ